LRPGDVLLPYRPLGADTTALAGLLPPWAEARRYAEPLLLEDDNTMTKRVQETAQASDTGTDTVVVFDPSHGALIDLQSLEGISSVSKHLSVALGYLLPALQSTGMTQVASAGLVLSGLKLCGIPAEGGPPGSVEPTRGAGNITLDAGVALLRWQGRFVAVEFEALEVEDLRKEGAPSSTSWAVVLELSSADDGQDDGCANQKLRGKHLLVRATEVDPAVQLVLAVSIPRTKRWETDLSALWQPTDPRTERLAKQLDDIAVQVWRESPEGLVWNDAVLGRDWLRYQAGAAAALQAAGLALESRALTTPERVRLLQSLHRRLVATVPKAAEAVRGLFGPETTAPPKTSAPTAPAHGGGNALPAKPGVKRLWSDAIPELRQAENARPGKR
jgi:hypothetical protein